jgi:hypothetical protein
MRKGPTERQVKELLRQCSFNPRKDHDYKIIADVGDKDYYITRALELLTVAKNATISRQDELLKTAVSLITLARLELPCNQDTPKKVLEPLVQ